MPVRYLTPIRERPTWPVKIKAAGPLKHPQPKAQKRNVRPRRTNKLKRATDLTVGLVGLTAVLGDITTMEVDAIVNAANAALAGGGGVDGAIHSAAGPTVLEECQAIIAEQGPCRTGRAVATSAGALPATWVIHVVGPIWDQHDPVENSTLLANCYSSSLDVAAELGARTVAFSAISTGVYGFPRELAAPIAASTVLNWLSQNKRHTSVDTVTLTDIA